MKPLKETREREGQEKAEEEKGREREPKETMDGWNNTEHNKNRDGWIVSVSQSVVHSFIHSIQVLRVSFLRGV